MVSPTRRKERRLRVRRRIRKRLRGTAERPRLAVFRSLKHIYAQVIDDDAQRTLVAASTVGRDFPAYGGNVAAAVRVGEMVAERARDAGIERLVFDRGGYPFHGRVQAVAKVVQAAGLLPPTRKRRPKAAGPGDPPPQGRKRAKGRK